MSNAELRKLNERQQLERTYKSLNPSAVKRGIKFVSGAASVMGTAMTLYNNSDRMVKLGKTVSDRIFDAAGDYVLKDISKNINI